MALLLLTGSDQAIFPMSVITTVGFTAFTRIYRDTHHHEDILREKSYLVWTQFKSHHFGGHVHTSFRSTYNITLW